jgi:hypothetical protein
VLGWDGQKALDRSRPRAFDTPAGSSHPIDYAAEGGPTVELRPQALFGLATHPMHRARRVPLVLSLTSPAGRPIQTTRDLPGFWKGSWAAVAKEMRGRYPRHPWPDDPAGAAPTLADQKCGCKAARNRDRGRKRVSRTRPWPPPASISAPRTRCSRAARAPTRGCSNSNARRAAAPDPLTGWAGSGDTREQVGSASRPQEAAIAYAEREGLCLHVIAAPERKLKLQAYADNFRRWHGPA